LHDPVPDAKPIRVFRRQLARIGVIETVLSAAIARHFVEYRDVLNTHGDFRGLGVPYSDEPNPEAIGGAAPRQRAYLAGKDAMFRPSDRKLIRLVFPSAGATAIPAVHDAVTELAELGLREGHRPETTALY
jgi:hypothetical protein